jgi:hypothetical protein
MKAFPEAHGLSRNGFKSAGVDVVYFTVKIVLLHICRLSHGVLLYPYDSIYWPNNIPGGVRFVRGDNIAGRPGNHAEWRYP